MAVKVNDGFDHYNNTTDFNARSDWLQYNSTEFDPVTGVDGIGKAMRLQDIITRATFSDRNAEYFIGHHVNPQSLGSSGATLIELVDTVADQPQITLVFSYSGYFIQVWRGQAGGGTLLYTSPNNVFQDNTWQFVEIHLVVDSSAGVVQVKNRGVFVVNLTGINTNNTGNAWSDAVQWSVGANNGQFDVDNFYYCDTTTDSGSSPNNTFLGECGTFTLFAVGNDSVQWTPLANTNWQEVSEQVMDSDTSYNYDATVGQEDLLNFQALTGIVAFIFTVRITGAYRKDDVGARSVKQAIKSSTTEVYGTTQSLPNTYVYFSDQWVLDPNTSANWNLSAVNALAAGYNVAA